MKKRKQPEPEVIKLENHLETSWQFRVNLTEADVRRLNDGIVPEWLQKDAEFWCRDNPKASDVNPEYQTHAQEDANDRKTAKPGPPRPAGPSMRVLVARRVQRDCPGCLPTKGA